MSSRTSGTEKYSAQDIEKWKPVEIRGSAQYGILPEGLKKGQTTTIIRNCQNPSKLYSCRSFQSEDSSSVKGGLVGYGIHRKQNILEDLQLKLLRKAYYSCEALVMLGTITGLHVMRRHIFFIKCYVMNQPNSDGSAEIRWINSDFLMLILLCYWQSTRQWH